MYSPNELGHGPAMGLRDSEDQRGKNSGPCLGEFSKFLYWPNFFFLPVLLTGLRWVNTAPTPSSELPECLLTYPQADLLGGPRTLGGQDLHSVLSLYSKWILICASANIRILIIFLVETVNKSKTTQLQSTSWAGQQAVWVRLPLGYT